ncbi:hypothetical protein [Bacillus cereus]|uniref:hypothetical protein n=1 Tax=Bacillus cereus TaxID=1396 RepID=UPI000BF979DE|nr:hypothetical protein [Bacillus cereus]PFQ01467.1 hypothetical protein COK12_26520 [Bacillus cereus]
MSNVSRCCLACGYLSITLEDKYQEVVVCPKCNGASVDIFKLAKYKQLSERTRCNGKPLTKEQVGFLEFMIHNYYKKNMDICSCDVERVLKKED